jgi:hypothetical protein
MTDCRHDKQHRAEVEVFQLTPDEQGEEGTDIVSVLAEVTIVCADCGAAFGFRGPPGGHSFHEPRCAVDAKKITLPLMTPAELELAGPLPVMARGPMTYEARP